MQDSYFILAALDRVLSICTIRAEHQTLLLLRGERLTQYNVLTDQAYQPLQRNPYQSSFDVPHANIPGGHRHKSQCLQEVYHQTNSTSKLIYFTTTMTRHSTTPFGTKAPSTAKSSKGHNKKITVNNVTEAEAEIFTCMLYFHVGLP